MSSSPYDRKVAEFLRERRGERTYREFAPILGITRSTLHRLENVEQSITLEKLHKLAKRMRTSVPEILGFKAK